MSEEQVSLVTLRRGAAVELVDEEIRRALANIVDPNTDPEASREITLTLKLKPEKDRERVGINISVKSKLAPPASCSASIWVLSTKRGIFGVEDDPHQRGLFEDPTPASENVASFAKEHGGEK